MFFQGCGLLLSPGRVRYEARTTQSRPSMRGNRLADDSKIVDESTTMIMIQSFAEVQDDCLRVQALVDGARSAMMAAWGGAAASAYDGSLTQWNEGFSKVRSALSLLNDSMTQYVKITTSTEDDNVVLGSGWANGGTNSSPHNSQKFQGTTETTLATQVVIVPEPTEMRPATQIVLAPPPPEMIPATQVTPITHPVE